MERHLPEEEADSIQWEGGEVNKGDEPGETRDPKKSPVLDDEELAQDDQSKPTS